MLQGSWTESHACRGLRHGARFVMQGVAAAAEALLNVQAVVPCLSACVVCAGKGWPQHLCDW